MYFDIFRPHAHSLGKRIIGMKTDGNTHESNIIADGDPQKDAQRDGQHAQQTAHQLALQDGAQQKVVLQQQLEAAREEPEEPREWPSSSSRPSPPWEAPACQSLYIDGHRRHCYHLSTAKATKALSACRPALEPSSSHQRAKAPGQDFCCSKDYN